MRGSVQYAMHGGRTQCFATQLLVGLACGALLSGALGCDSGTAYSVGADAESLQARAEAARYTLQRPDSNVTTAPMLPQADSNVTVAPFTAPAEAARSSVSRMTAADRQAMALAAELRCTQDEAERAEFRKQLVEALEAAFEERREWERQAIDRVERQLQERRELYQRRGERREEIVQRRLNELLGEPDVLSWELEPICE